MIGPVRTWSGGLTARERGLVAVATGLALAVVLVFGIVLPLGRAHDAAHVRHRQAVETSSRLLAQLAALEAPAPRRATLAGPVSQVVAASADSAGFVLQSNQARGAEAAVIAFPHPRWGERPAAFVVPASGSEPSPEELKAFLQGAVASWWVPDVIEIVAELPRTGESSTLPPL